MAYQEPQGGAGVVNDRHSTSGHHPVRSGASEVISGRRFLAYWWSAALAAAGFLAWLSGVAFDWPGWALGVGLGTVAVGALAVLVAVFLPDDRYRP